MHARTEDVTRAKAGDVEAYGRLVEATQAMAYAVTFRILRDPALAEDATQEAYLRAFRRLEDLQEPAAFASWLRRVAITVAMNIRRARRTTLLRLDDVPDVPVLDEAETAWSEAQWRRLGLALLSLTPSERLLCDRRYYGRWNIRRLAEDAGVDQPAMRKRLQRIRDKLRKEMEMSEQNDVQPGGRNSKLPAKIVDLLARPRLTDLPDNPVGDTLARIRNVFAEFSEINDLPEIVDLAEARNTAAADAMYLEQGELHHIDKSRILRYDLTLPLLLTVRYQGQPLRLWASGKVYRACQIDATHLEAFHQAEVLLVDEQKRVSPWRAAALVLQSVHEVLPSASVKVVPTQYPMCSQAWELEVECDGYWSEVLAWGVYTSKIVTSLGGDPSQVSAIGIGYGLERLAMLRYGIDDIRRVEGALIN